MRQDKKVQFVTFETTLDSEQFIKRWEQYTRSSNSDVDVTLQQSEKNGVFTYIAQHRLADGELQFVFSKEGRTSRIVQARIKTTQAGGYSMLQDQRLNDVNTGEKKVFVFLTDPRADLTIYRKLPVANELNIYQAYYENCKYAFILEYFVKNKYVPQLTEQLKQNNIAEIGIYKKCNLVRIIDNKATQDTYAWPK